MSPNLSLPIILSFSFLDFRPDLKSLFGGVSVFFPIKFEFELDITPPSHFLLLPHTLRTLLILLRVDSPPHYCIHFCLALPSWYIPDDPPCVNPPRPLLAVRNLWFCFRWSQANRAIRLGIRTLVVVLWCVFGEYVVILHFVVTFIFLFVLTLSHSLVHLDLGNRLNIQELSPYATHSIS